MTKPWPYVRCPQCFTPTTTVTLGGFLTVARCDSCQWYNVHHENRNGGRRPPAVTQTNG